MDRTGTLQIDNNDNWLYSGTSEVGLMSSVLTTESVGYGTDNVYPIFNGYFLNFAINK